MKHKLLLPFIYGSILVLSGCWNRVEINDLAIVTAAAIDKKGKNGTELSVQVFIPKALSTGGGNQMGGGGGASGDGTTMIVSESGRNLADALSKLQGNLPRKIFWGQCKIFIFGEKLAKEGIQQPMDLLLRHPQIRERALLFVSEGKARRFLELPSKLERYSAENIRELSKTHIGMVVTIQDIDEKLMGKGHSAAIPYLTTKIFKQSSGEATNSPRILGTAVFKKDKMIGIISERVTRGILWVLNDIKDHTVVLHPGNTKGDVSLNPVSAQIKLDPVIKYGKWAMDINVQTEGSVFQNRTNLDLENPDYITMIQKAYRKAIANRMKLALDKVQHQLKIDIISFADAFFRKYPQQFKKVEDHWDQVFANIDVNIEVNASINRQGFITNPGSLPENEVKEK